MTGFAAVAAAADRAMRDRSPDPAQPDEGECPQLVRELEVLYDDPITRAYGVAHEVSPLVTRLHVERHGCQGWGRP